MSELKPYLQYKGSGVVWLGGVPEDWQIHSLKRSIDGYVNGIWGAEPNGLSDLPVIRVADFDYHKRTVSIEKLIYRGIKEPEAINRLLQNGDLLLEKSWREAVS